MKRVLDGEVAIVNQLIQAEDKTPYRLWKTGKNNNWDPTEIDMSKDVFQWKTKDSLTDDEKLLVKRVLGFFSATESLVANNLLLSVTKYVTDGACRQYIARQVFEESLHNSTIEVCCEAYGLDREEVAEAYKNIEAIKKKDEFLMSVTSDLARRDFDISTIEGKQEFIRNVFAFYVICEGIFFYSGFAMALSLGRQNKMTGLCDQIRFTLRDESLHIEFGTYLLNRIKTEYPEVWTPEFSQQLVDMLKTAVALEIEYAHEALPNGILGMNAPMFLDYVQYIANRRLTNLGLNFQFPNNKNPFPWLSESADVDAMGAFFERRERAYQQAGALEDDL